MLVDEENVPVLGDTQLWELGISLGENEAAAEKSGFCGIYDMNRANLRLAIADTLCGPWKPVCFWRGFSAVFC